MLVKSYFISCIHTFSEDAQCGTKKAISNACRDIGGAGEEMASETKKKVKRESLGEGESGAGCWCLRLQTMINDQMKKIIQNMQKTPTAQNQHTYVQGG